jgi:outer membrane receptor protein involved in Fe transport
LNPFTSYADPYNLRRGNPAVNPEFIDSYEIGFAYLLNKLSLNSSVYYRNTTDVLQRFRVYYADGSAAVTYINLDRSENIGFELVASYKTFSWFKNVFSFNGNQIKYYDQSVVFASNYGFYWSLKYVGNITFWKKTATVQLNGKYNAPIVTAQGTVQPRASLDISFEKKIKDSKWVLGAKITDVFNSKEFVINVNQPFVVQNSTFKQTTRRFYVTVAYKFGKLEINKKSRVNSDNSGGGMDF